MLRGRKDAEGQFLRQALGDRFFITSTGYRACLSASGKNLGGNPARALEAFHKLPLSERDAGKVTVAKLDVDVEAAAPSPPPGGLVLKVYGRFLARDDEGKLRYSSAKDFPRMAKFTPKQVRRASYLFEVSYTDFVWLKEAEWKTLVPANAKVGDTIEIPEAITRRLCIYHLAPRRLFGEGGGFNRKSLREVKLTLTVTKASPTGTTFRLNGLARLGSMFDAVKTASVEGPAYPLGFEPEIQGSLYYDTAKKAFTRFDMVVAGDCWGRLGDANNNPTSIDRPGRYPIAFAFEIVDPSVPANRLVPAGRASRVRPGGVYWK